MLNFRQLEVFRAVMIAKTVSGAARMLNTSQPGLSRMLKHMEGKLGLVLFDRVAGRLVPTREASVLFDELQQVYKGVANLSAVVARLQHGEDLTFTVGASPSLGHYFMPEALSELRRMHPQLRLHYDTLPVNQVEDYLAFGRGEYALTVFPLDHPSITSRTIGEARMVCVAPPGHRLSGRELIELGELEGEPLISFEPETPHGSVIAAMFEASGMSRDVAVTVRFAETACEFVELGVGVALVDAFTAKRWAHPARTLGVKDAGRLPIVLHRSRAIARSNLSAHFESILDRLIERERRA